jgi:hypothetical protein
VRRKKKKKQKNKTKKLFLNGEIGFFEEKLFQFFHRENLSNFIAEVPK